MTIVQCVELVHYDWDDWEHSRSMELQGENLNHFTINLLLPTPSFLPPSSYLPNYTTQNFYVIDKVGLVQSIDIL